MVYIAMMYQGNLNWMMKRRIEKLRSRMDDRNILYDYVWDEETLDVYRQMCCNSMPVPNKQR